jgi:hypothetical protein
MAAKTKRKLGNALAAIMRRRQKELGSIKLLAGELGLGVANTQRMLSAGGAYHPQQRTLRKITAWGKTLKTKGSKASKPDKRRKSGKARKPRSTKARTVIPANFIPEPAPAKLLHPIGRVTLTSGRVTLECAVSDVAAVIQQLRN